MKNNTPTIKVLIGPQNCGKSTWVANNATFDEVIISRDSIILEQHPELQYNDAYKLCNHKNIDKLFKERLFQAIADKKSIIVDKMNLTSKSRRKILANVPKLYTKIAILFNWDFEILKERNIKRNIEQGKLLSEKCIQDAIDSYVPIREEEGFNKVIQIR